MLSNFAPVLAFAITVAILGALLSARLRGLVLDEPTDRSLHERPVPRTGGLAVMAGTIAGGIWLGMDRALVAALAILVAVSFLDDWRSLPAGLRLAAHVGVSIWFCLTTFNEEPWYLVVVFAFALAWMANLYNFMDGADGLAGGMSVIGFAAYGIAAGLTGHQELLWLSLTVSAAAFAFLRFNFAPARIFLGDAGSIPLGFLAGVIGMLGWHSGVWPVWFPAVVFASFVVDASATLVQRLGRGEPFWRPHRSHYYQRLILLGWTHRRMAIAQYGLMSLCAVAALVARGASTTVQTSLLLLLVLCFGALMRWIDSMWDSRPMALRQ